MLSRRLLLNVGSVRNLSNETKKGAKRFMQTIPITTKGDLSGAGSLFDSGLNYASQSAGVTGVTGSKWAKHTLGFPSVAPREEAPIRSSPVRRSRASRFAKPLQTTISIEGELPASVQETPIVEAKVPSTPQQQTTTAAQQTASTTAPVVPKPKRTLRPRKALITLSENAVEHLRHLLNQPQPKLIRIGVSNRGCSGLTYNLEYVDKPGKFDELIEQGDVKVLIDSKALFSIVGSEMDWLDDKLSSRFIFKNPNSKGTCGCGESFMV